MGSSPTGHPIYFMQSGNQLSLYLDTCIAIGYVQRDLQPQEQTASESLFSLYEENRIKLVTSPVTKVELENYAKHDQKIRQLKIYDLLAQLPQLKTKRVMDMISSGIIPFAREDPSLTSLKKILKEKDAEHVFHASLKVDYFVTTDKNMLKRSQQIEDLCGVRVISPHEASGLIGN